MKPAPFTYAAPKCHEADALLDAMVACQTLAGQS